MVFLHEFETRICFMNSRHEWALRANIDSCVQPFFSGAKRNGVFAAAAVCVSERNRGWSGRRVRACSQTRTDGADTLVVDHRPPPAVFFMFCSYFSFLYFFIFIFSNFLLFSFSHFPQVQHLVPMARSVADMYPVADLEFGIPVLVDKLVIGQVQSSDEVTQPRVVVAVSGGDVGGLPQTVLAASHATHELVQSPAAVRAVDVDRCFPHPPQWLQHVVAERLQIPHHLFCGDVRHEGEPLTPCQFLHREVRRIKFMLFHKSNHFSPPPAPPRGGGKRFRLFL